MLHRIQASSYILLIAALTIGCKAMPSNEALTEVAAVGASDSDVIAFAKEELRQLDSDLYQQHKEAVRLQELYEAGKPGGKDMRFDTENYWSGLPDLNESEQAIYDRYMFNSRKSAKTHKITKILENKEELQFLLDTEQLKMEYDSLLKSSIAKNGYGLLVTRLKLESRFFEKRMHDVSLDIENSKRQGGITKSTERLLVNYADAYYRRISVLESIHERLRARLILFEGKSAFEAEAIVQRAWDREYQNRTNDQLTMD